MVCVQERAETVEAQLAEVTNEVQELRVRQKQLEARNHLLEKVAVLNKQTDQSSNPSSEQVAFCSRHKKHTC